MDASTRDAYLALLSWTGPHTQGLGDLLREHGSPDALIEACAHERAADHVFNHAPNHARNHASELASTGGSAKIGVSVADSRLQQGGRESQAFAELRPALQRALLSARRQWPRRNPRSSPVRLDRGETFLPLGDPKYPAVLREIPDPPPWLFCRGDPRCLARPAVAIVGSRRASHAGLRAAQAIAERFALAGSTVCSGLALGIDAAAHRGALRGGVTCAVLASGIDQLTPLRHRDLAEEIQCTGCLLSELPPGTPPSKMQFPRRNRIISGLAQATIIVEAALPSGSLHTAASALEQGRDVYTLPWSIFHAQGAGCLRLIRDGATPITSLEELGEYFPQLQPAVADKQTAAVADDDTSLVLRLVGDDGLTLAQLGSCTGLAPSALLALLGELEISGVLHCRDGLYLRS